MSKVNTLLKITEPNGRTRDFELIPGAVHTIGRFKENNIVLNDRRVSRKHAWIEPTANGYKLVDGYIEDGVLKRSVNHVFVNGAPALERILQDGDRIVIGETTIVIEIAPAPGASSPVAQQSQTSIPIAKPEPRPDLRSVVQNAPTVVDVPAGVNFDDKPLGQTQLRISANEIIGRQSHLSMESEYASPEEIKDLRRKARMLELLYEMSRSLGTVFDLKEIFEKATDLIFRGTPADRVVALLADETIDGRILDYSLVPVGIKTRDANVDALTEKLTISRTITQKVMREKVALLSQDAKTDEQFLGAESIVAQGVRSTICAPLITESNVHGVLYADRLDPFAAFTPDHLELISAVAAQTAVTVETVKAHKRLAREEVARANYSRFMPEYVVKQLLEHPESFRLGGINQSITVLFADIRGFTTLSEKENPEKVVALLNRYFSLMTEIIFEHGGTLDKFIGDGLMAIFGAPTASPEDALNAVKAAVTMQKRLIKLNEEFRAEGYSQVAMGIGLHTGVATIGYIGSDKRSEYTAIGDTVNLASRLESNALGGQILISDATLQASGNRIPVIAREPLTVRNRIQPVEVYEIKWA
ncbi:adenylate/guanylate cyclase domain-containing protein [Leptolyngbya sp. 7M]|uniref:adenylate/guanylate cyclase domain-containing protein n=1 Tax=Leptolyngbya sp. 7M TaxID=2812896 RepID=UPI001B8D4B6F|nr:adenylate/guanylate cyclase domain-containing protein [Leptolyngbya sp. 7M]QYO66934.1 GAF domain-containing protein [Leptolyngbya sp. 7M]